MLREHVKLIFIKHISIGLTIWDVRVCSFRPNVSLNAQGTCETHCFKTELYTFIHVRGQVLQFQTPCQHWFLRDTWIWLCYKTNFNRFIHLWGQILQFKVSFHLTAQRNCETHCVKTSFYKMLLTWNKIVFCHIWHWPHWVQRNTGHYCPDIILPSFKSLNMSRGLQSMVIEPIF